MKNYLFRLGHICLFLYTFTAFAGIEEDFKAHNSAQLTQNFLKIDQESQPESPCYKNLGHAKCVVDLASKSSPGSGFAFFTTAKFIQDTIKQDLEKQMECKDLCQTQILIFSNFAIADMIFKIKPEDLTVRTWAKSRPVGTPGLLYIQITEEFAFFNFLQKRVADTLYDLNGIQNKPGIPPQIKSRIDDYLKKLAVLDLNEKFKDGVLFDQTITLENILKDYDLGQAAGDSAEVKAQKRKSINDIFTRINKPPTPVVFSKYVEYSGKEINRIMAWKENNFDKPGECPAGFGHECYGKFLKAHPPQTSAGIGAAFSLSMNILIKERSIKECDQACKLKVTVKIYEIFNDFSSQLKITNLPVSKLRQKNLGKPGMLGLQALEEILIGNLIMKLNTSYQSMFTTLASKPGTSPEAKTQYEKMLLELKATNYKAAFEGSIITDASIVPAVVEADIKNTPEDSETADLMKKFLVLREALLKP